MVRDVNDAREGHLRVDEIIDVYSSIVRDVAELLRFVLVECSMIHEDLRENFRSYLPVLRERIVGDHD